MRWVGVGLILIGSTWLYVTHRVYRFLLRLLDDPDTWKLLDGKETP